MATILVVDDQPDNLYVLQRLLKGHGYTVMTAERGAQALELAETRQPDLVLLDVMMPEMDGFEVVQRLRANAATQSIPVVLLTANAPDERLKIQGLNLGADEYLTQPINNNELLARVRALLRTKQAQDALVRRNTQLAALLDIVQASTSTLDLGEVGQRLLAGALAATGMDMGGIWLLEGAELVALAQVGFPAEVSAARERVPLAETQVSAQAMLEQQPIYGAPRELYGPEHPLARVAETIVVLPLLHRGESLGVLQLATRQARQVDAEELAFLGAIVNAAATAVQNARLYAESNRHRQELELLDREKDEFISIISHELKNPLASIKGYAGLLQRRAKKDPTLQSAVKGLEVIEQQANRMSALLDQLRDVSQIGMDRFMIEPVPLDLTQLTQRVALDMQATTTSHEILLNIGAEPLMALIDEFRMSQVLSNLISNAIKYSPAGGPVEIEVYRSATPPHQPLELMAREWAVVTVRDHGIGIPKEAQERLFQRFFRAPNAKGGISGMGLGLYITREIVQRHGGYIWVESAEGQGSTFGVALPLLDEAAAAATHTALAEPVADATGR
ncbi:ATP-binding protein [Kallotenue papyrolyticum]|uniref:ATP-binding response regulator n=1 Tax=Kallotenue papyrolyticum TaxID=1325125 RepID=UPI0004785DA5|nr:ATP-binding protein [Kallotenue papyrolyticum]